MGGSLDGHAGELRRLREKRRCREHEAGGNGATAIRARSVDHVDVGCRAKVHHDDGRAVGEACCHGVGNAVGAHLGGVGHVDAHAGVRLRGHDQRLCARAVEQALVPGAGEHGHHARDSCSRDACLVQAVLVEVAVQAGVDHVGGVRVARRHAPAVRHGAVLVKEAERGLGVANVNREKHGRPSLVRVTGAAVCTSRRAVRLRSKAIRTHGAPVCTSSPSLLAASTVGSRKAIRLASR